METLIMPAGAPPESFATTHRATHIPTPAGFIRIGIQTRVEIALITPGGLSSPAAPAKPRCQARPVARKSNARCELPEGHAGPHTFDIPA